MHLAHIIRSKTGIDCTSKSMKKRLSGHLHITSIRMDLNRALQSMAERELLEYARSNITINLNSAAAEKAEDPSLQSNKEQKEK